MVNDATDRAKQREKGIPRVVRKFLNDWEVKHGHCRPARLKELLGTLVQYSPEELRKALKELEELGHVKSVRFPEGEEQGCAITQEGREAVETEGKGQSA